MDSIIRTTSSEEIFSIKAAGKVRNLHMEYKAEVNLKRPKEIKIKMTLWSVAISLPVQLFLLRNSFGDCGSEVKKLG